MTTVRKSPVAPIVKRNPGPPAHLQGVPEGMTKIKTLGALEGMSWAKIPTYYYDFRRFQLPLTAAEFDDNFGRNIPIFDNSPDTGCTRQTNAATGSGVNEPFCALGAGIVAMGEGESFTINGSLIRRTGAPTTLPNAILLVTGEDCYCGAVDLQATDNGATDLAQFWWGGPTWRFVEKFFQAYRLQVLVGSRFLIVDESLFDVGMTPVPPEFVGASCSDIPAMPFVRATNNVMAEKAINDIFIPANIFIDSNSVSHCLPTPLAGVTYGHPRIIGLANRIYCFPQPICFLPGMRFEVNFFNVEDPDCYGALQRSTQTTCDSPDAVFTGLTAADSCGQVCTVPGGSVSLGVVFKGVAMWPQAVVEYLAQYLLAGSMQSAMYANSANHYISGLLGQAPEVAKANEALNRKRARQGLPERDPQGLAGFIGSVLGSPPADNVFQGRGE